MYRFNDFLSESNAEIKKNKHTSVTDDFIAAEEIQNQNWQYYIEQVLEFCHNKEIGETIKKSKTSFLFDTVENITIAKKSYGPFYNTIQQTVQKLSSDEYNKLKEDFDRENFWSENVVEEIDNWISFYFKKGRLPSSQKLIMLPLVEIPNFIKTQISLLLIDLYRKFVETDAKALVSVQALAALDIHFGGDRTISKNAMKEFLTNLTFQALTNQNDDVVMSYENIGNLVIDLLESFIKFEQELFNESKILSEKLKEQINKTDYKLEIPPELEIQEDVVKYQKEEKKVSPEPVISSTPLKTDEIEEMYDEEKENYLKTAIKIHKTDIDTAIENAEESNMAVIDEIIDQAPSLIVDNKFNIDYQFKYQTTELEKNHTLSNQIQERLDDLLTKMKQKTDPVGFMIPKPTEEIPNDPLSSEQPEPIDIYLEDEYYYTYDDKLIFPQLSTDDRKDFELNIVGDDFIVFKSPTLKTISISRKELKN